MDNAQNNTVPKTVTYETDKIQNLLNAINKVSFQGIQQAQIIMQIVAVLGEPIEDNEQNESK